MTTEIWLSILGLGVASYAIRLGGYLLALRLPQEGGWARGMEALPGCLIVALVVLMMIKGGTIEWIAGGVVLLVAAKTRNLPTSMLVGMGLVAGMRILVL
ncbi:AzlD family protein [Cochlodiniinecator piscidefendens]|uniref:AzlD family protein n=1 Tax=Cochlodiniinecator piscidefendens TaxID=2715756 RepID=UPI00140D975A|nr:AzlD domain-containing protein [Cochlodiniinecator piscidefendens]